LVEQNYTSGKSISAASDDQRGPAARPPGNLIDHPPFVLDDWFQIIFGSGAIVDSDLPGSR
jgi:hypothetical protein